MSQLFLWNLMELKPAYLGLFSRILNWVMDKIFTPIFEWLAGLLSDVLSWLFETVLGPLIQAVFEAVFPVLWDMFLTLFSKVLYQILVVFCKLIDYVEYAFDVLIGLKNVTYTPATGAATSDSLLNVLFFQKDIRTAFLLVTLLGIALAGMFAIFAVARSSFDLEGEGRRPVGRVLNACFKTILNFMLVPVFCYFFIQLSGVLLSGINTALGGTNTSLGTTIFLIASLDAAKDETYRTDPSLDDALRQKYQVQAGKARAERDYTNINTVEKDFIFKEMDFIVGFASGIFLVIILAFCLIVFVQRLFQIILLYIISPLFVSTMPLDDGERFGKWREMFVGKVFSGFGAAIGMRLYLMLLPLLMSKRIDFTGGGSVSSEMDYVIRLLLIMGGAYAIYKSSSMITGLISMEAASSEQAVGSMAGGFIAGQTIGRMQRLGNRAVGAIGSGLGKGVGAVGSGFSSMRHGISEAGKLRKAGFQESTQHANEGERGAGKGAGKSSGGFGSAGSGAGAGADAGGGGSGTAGAGADAGGGGSGTAGAALNVAAAVASTAVSAVRSAAVKGGQALGSAAKSTASSLAGSSRPGNTVSFGRLFRVSYNGNDGKLQSARILGMDLRKQEGKLQSLSFGKNFSIGRDPRTGKKQISSIKLGNFRVDAQPDGKRKVSSANLGFMKLQRQPDGRMRVASFATMDFGYTRNADGKYELSGFQGNIIGSDWSSRIRYDRENGQQQEQLRVQQAQALQQVQQRNEARSRVGSAPSVQQQAAEAARRRREMGMSIQQAVRSVDADVKMNRSEQRALQQSEARSRVGADSTVQQQAAEAARRRLEMSMSTREAAASVDADVRKDESFRQQQLDALRSEARSRLNANSTAQQQMVEAARRRQELGMSTRDAVASVDADIRRYQESLSAQQAQQRQQEMRAEARSRLSADSTVQDQMVEAARRRLEMGMSTREATASVGADMESHQINRREQMAQEGYRIATETVIERKLRAVQAHTKKVPQVRKVTPAVNPRQSGESSGQR